MSLSYPEHVKSKLAQLFPEQTEYLQAVNELIDNLNIDKAWYSRIESDNMLERLFLPDRIINFNVQWRDDNGKVNINQGWRVQHSNLIGPYKGGLRFHPSVNESVLKFLALEQTFKNALTGLPIGGAKGGSNFDPKGKSQGEILRFCQAFMDELYRYIGPNTDIPAGDINVGSREIGFLFGRYKKITNQFDGALTGKNVAFGGSQARIESTGYGVIYFIEEALKRYKQSLASQRVLISGSGNVALHAAKKAIKAGATVITLSNSEGVCVNSDGFKLAMIDNLIEENTRPALDKLAEKLGAEWHADETPWSFNADIAIPCATQNELSSEDAKLLIDNGISYVFEGANMPCSAEAIELFERNEVLFAPAKAVNSGGVITSTLEMGQNAIFFPESFESVSEKLRALMSDIHKRCVRDNDKSYLKGANNAALSRLLIAMTEQGV